MSSVLGPWTSVFQAHRAGLAAYGRDSTALSGLLLPGNCWALALWHQEDVALMGGEACRKQPAGYWPVWGSLKMTSQLGLNPEGWAWRPGLQALSGVRGALSQGCAIASSTTRSRKWAKELAWS